MQEIKPGSHLLEEIIVEIVFKPWSPKLTNSFIVFGKLGKATVRSITSQPLFINTPILISFNFKKLIKEESCLK